MEWLATVEPFFDSIGLQLPIGAAEDPTTRLPDAIGRNRSHTEDWHELHDEMTRTYLNLGRTEANRIMEDPDDV